MILAVLAPVALLGSALLLPDGRTAEVDVACDPASVVVLDDTAYAACAAAGVLAIDVKGEEPRVLGLVALPGSVSGLHTSGGKVWAEVTRLEAYPLERPPVSLVVSGPRESAAGVPTDTAVVDKAAPKAGSRLFPARHGGVGSLALTLRPLLPLGTIGAGAIAHATAAYHFERPIAVGLVVEPLAGALTNDRNVGNVGVTGFVAYDHDYFALGLGVGVTTLSELVYGNDGFPSSQNAAILIAQLARIGALDGLNLTIRNSFAVIADEFDYNGTVARLQVPLSQTISLFGAGGAAQGFAFGELGVRFRAFGTGASDTLFVDLSAGGGSVDGIIDLDDCGDGRPCRSTDSYGGPLVGAGVEYRL
ncbi:MAG TPA: hypothetical protein VLC93_10805 [Myxococcota bacterium]|nr:hypothetical protein [Myxococcota bacterium]